MKKFVSSVLILSSLLFASCKNNSKGELTVYATSLSDYVKAVCEKFEQNTGIKTTYEFKSGTEILKCAESEDNAGDVWFGGSSDVFNEAAVKGLLYPYKSKNCDHLIDPKYRDKDYNWYGIYIGILGFFWDETELEKRNIMQPFDWDDLLKPEYKGLITMGNPETSGTGKLIINTLVQLKGYEPAMEYFHQLDKNISLYTAQGVQPAIMIPSGKGVIGIGFLHDVIRSMLVEDNHNIGITTPVSGTSYELGATAIFKNSKNLANAKKFIDFALTPECANLAHESGAYQLMVIKGAETVEEAVAAGLDKIETIDYDFEDVKKNGSTYYKGFFENINYDQRVRRTY